MKPLQPHETVLVGSWIICDGRSQEDEICQRIEWLIQQRLRRLASSVAGWDKLYLDTDDGRLWELVYPQSERHGGGPPALRTIGRQQASVKYKL